MAAKRRTAQTQSGVAQGKLDAKLLAYCAMASGALLAAPPADASVVYSGVKNLNLDSSHRTAVVDFDNDVVNEIQFNFVNSSGGSTIRLHPLDFDSIAGRPFKIAAGALIGSGLAWGRYGGTLNNAWGAYGGTGRNCGGCGIGGSFANETGYIGVKFNIGSQKHYGWIQYHGGSGAQCYFHPILFRCVSYASAGGLIIDWAYETTPDYPILAGQTTGTGTDTDGDGIYDSGDNCPALANPGQLDADNDGTGDCCDTAPGCGSGCGQTACDTSCDSDNDGVTDALDNCPQTPNGATSGTCVYGGACTADDQCNTSRVWWNYCDVGEKAQVDFDGDGLGDCCDNCPGEYNPDQTDDDHDGMGDVCWK